MKIHLKRNNWPKEPGIYLCREFSHESPQLAKVERKHDGLFMLYYGEVFHISGFREEALWSDRIEIEFP